jgi:hypothetical protein
MLGGPGSLDYIQSGYLRSVAEYVAGNVGSPNNTYFFAAYNNGWQNEVFKATNTTSIGENHHYWEVDQTKGPYAGQMFEDSNQILQSSFEPSAVWSTRNDEFSGETHDPQDFMVGTTASHAQFTYLGYSNAEDSTGNYTWINYTRNNFTGGWFQDTPNYQQAWLYSGGTDPAFGIWDSRH